LGNRLYKYKGNLYILLNHCEFKHPDTREWISAVVYTPCKDKDVKVYVRESVEFFDRFEEVIDD